MPIQTKCDRCGINIEMPPSQFKRSKRHFCSQQCGMKTLNEELNPGRMNPETREKLREHHLGLGEGKSYAKTYGRHTHRVIAEEKIGRQLLPGEVVHHVDENKRNNEPENLMVFSSQAEHAAWHARLAEVEVMLR